MTVETFLASATVTENDCWIWQGRKDSKGYGKCLFQGNYDAQAHRVSYRLFRGDIPQGAYVCHSCDTPLCVNPEHLWLGTAQDNMADMVAKGRQSRPRADIAGDPACPHSVAGRRRRGACDRCYRTWLRQHPKAGGPQRDRTSARGAGRGGGMKLWRACWRANPGMCRHKFHQSEACRFLKRSDVREAHPTMEIPQRLRCTECWA